jgi:hypothetical protein
MAALSLLYWFTAGLRAAYRPFWYDELVTWHLARLFPDVGALWGAITKGADSEMPLTHIFVRASQTLFGDGYFATRLPMLLGFWFMLLGLFAFLKKRLPVPYSLIGVIFPMITFAWPYAYEARAYGIALGGAGIALIAWQNAAEGRHRALSLVAITVSLAVVLASQSTLAVVAIPFALGEAVRTYDRRRIDFPVWLAFAASIPVVLLYLPVWNAVQSNNLTGRQPSVFAIAGFFDEAFKTVIFPFIGAAATAYLLAHREKPGAAVDHVLLRHEAAAMTGFMLTPLPFFIGGMFSSKFFFFPRYGILCVIGVAAWVAVFLFRAAGGNRRIGFAVLLALAGWVALSKGKEAVALAHDPAPEWRQQVPLLSKALADGRPVVVTDGRLYLEAEFYMPELAPNLYWVTADPAVAAKYPGQSLSDQLLSQQFKATRLRSHLATWNEFSRQYSSFFLFTGGGADGANWWYATLPAEGWRLSVSAGQSAAVLYEGTRIQ